MIHHFRFGSLYWIIASESLDDRSTQLFFLQHIVAMDGVKGGLSPLEDGLISTILSGRITIGPSLFLPWQFALQNYF